jgi:enamine deaminase RidA (YjgF/YER057c/UK114 family)
MKSINRLLRAGGSEAPVTYRKRKPILVLTRVGNLLFTSGHGPEDQITGKPLFAGRIGRDLTAEEGYQAARECGKILIGALRDHLGTLDSVKSIVKMTALVNVEEGFSDLDGVADGFSDLMTEVFDQRGYHVRTLMGTHNLPNGNIPIEIEMIVEVEE